MFNLDDMDKPVDVAGGEWVSEIPNHPGVRLKVRSRNYKPFNVAHDALLRSFGKRATQAHNSPVYQAKAGALLADHILLDWENAVQVKGKPAPYDKEIAVKVLTSVDERGMGQTFRDVVAYAAGIVADNHLGMAEDIAGN